MSTAHEPTSHSPLLGVSHAWANMAGARWMLWLLVAAWFLEPALSAPYFVGKAQDWAYFNQHATSAWLSWTVYGQLPQWEPFSCGGLPAIGNLQGTPVGLTQLLAALFGLMPGQRIASFIFIVLGMEGGFRYARHRGAHGFGAITAGLLFGLSGRFVQLFHDGQPVFLSFELTPWALLCLEKGWRQWRYAVVGSLVMALLLLEGGAVPTPLVSVLLGFVALLRTAVVVVRRDPDDEAWWRPVATLALMAALTLGLTLWRVIPVAESLIAHPRVWHGEDTYSIGHVINMVFRRGARQGYTADGSSLVGMGAALLFSVALLARDKRAPWLLALTLACLDLATGRSEGIGLFPILKSLPVLENLRNPFRFGIFAGFFVAVGAGIGISVIEEHIVAALRAKMAHRWAAIVAGLATVVIAAAPAWQVAEFGHDRLQKVFIRQAPRHVIRPFRQSIGNRWVADVWPAQHRGSLSCFEEQPFFQAAGLRADRPHEEFLVDPEAGVAERSSWSPHRIVVDVQLKRPTRLLVNQNHHRAWGSDVGSVVRHEGHISKEPRIIGKKDGKGLIGIDLPAGKHRIELTFSDPWILFGLAVALLTLGLMAGLTWRHRATLRARP
ncbi:MAG: hypothetical protein KC502_12225 [Myxococcales bacterium]|nr:hypothetical protein [Myxococcales bacterium]